MKPTIEQRIKEFKEANPDLSQGIHAFVDKVHSVVIERYETEESYLYIDEIFEDYVVFRQGGSYWKVGYEIVNDEVMLMGDRTEVEKKVTYEAGKGKNHKEIEISEHRKKGELFKESSFDHDNLIIKNVSLMGAESANGYTYTEGALKDAQRLLEGTVQYINHDFSDLPRDVMGSFSETRNVRYDASKQKVVGEMHLVDTPLIRNEVFPRIERFSNKFGNSIVGYGEAEEQDGHEFVTTLTAIESCDLVSDPATNKGLFESVLKNRNKSKERGEQDMKFTAKDVRENKEVYDELKQEILKEIKDGQTMETLRKDNERLEKENKKLSEKVDGYEREKKISEKREFIDQQIKEAKLPDIAVTATWKKSLLDMDEPDIKTAVSELKESVEKLTDSTGNYEKDPDSMYKESGDSMPSVSDIGSFARRVVN